MPIPNSLCRAAAIALSAAFALAACGSGTKDDQDAYNACLNYAKAKMPTAEFVPFEKARINSMQDGTVAVIIDYKLDGKAAFVDCNTQKQQNQTFKVNYSNVQ
jgi:hypothetical protein